jgi:hypothetical protein
MIRARNGGRDVSGGGSWAATARFALLLFLLAGWTPAPEAAEPGEFLQMVAIAPDTAAPDPSADSRWTIFLDGLIDGGAADRLTRFIERRGVMRAAVYLNSPGGSLVESMALGRVFRQHGFATVVGARDATTGGLIAGVCYSACPFAFAGGIRRQLAAGSVLGVHRAENRTPVPDEAGFQQHVAHDTKFYLAEMGVGEPLIGIMAEVPHDAIRLLSLDEAEQLRLVTDR